MRLSFLSVLCLTSVIAACSDSHTLATRESDEPMSENPASTLIDGGRDADDSEDETPVDGGAPTVTDRIDGGDGGNDGQSACPVPDSSERAGAPCTGDLYCRYVVETCACDTLYEHYSCNNGVLEHRGRDYDCRPCPVPADYECPAEPPEGFPGPDAPETVLCHYEDLLCECTGETYDVSFRRYRGQWIIESTPDGESPCRCPSEP